MYPRVTAILVARNGAEYLQRTLEALAAQTRRPDRIITIDCASSDGSGDMLVAAGPDHALMSAEELNFGAAIATAVRVTEPPTTESEMLWLLSHDSAPDVDALANLLATLEVSPSLAVAGPKLMDWDTPERIAEFGETVTPFGTSVVLVTDELDQEQHDIRSDVMAVSAAGMLVRHRVWDELGGFDPGLPHVDDALDFCVRVRLHGSRVAVVPSAKVLSAGDGIAGRDTSPAASAHRIRARRRRRAQLHRRLTWAPAAAVPVHWLSLVPLAILRSLLLLLRKDPGLIVGELAAALGAAFNGIPVSNARRSIARTRTTRWAAVAPLRMSVTEVRHRRALARETGIVTARGEREPTQFFAAGGAWTVLAAALVSVLVFLPLLAAPALTGGGLLPLSGAVSTLWQNAAFGWREIGVGFVGAADPFAAVLAVLGSITFWSPSLGLVVLWVLALPLAALGAWFAATRITDRAWLRALGAVLWVLAPPFLSALQDGRPGGVMAHLLLPWLVFTAAAAARSWSSSAASALLFAAIVASAPSLTPALLVVWLICVVVSGHNFTRFIGIPVPALVLAAPLIWQQWMRGTPLALLADPGLAQSSVAASVPQLVLGLPDGQLGGWPELLARFGLQGVPLMIIIPAMLVSLALAGLFALFVPGSRRGLIALFAALLGLATAVGASHLVLASIGDAAVGVWAGSGLSLYWLGIVAAAILGLGALGRFAVAPAVVIGVVSVLFALPLALAVPLGTASVRPSDGATLPAFVSAEAKTEPRVGTLELTAQNDGALLAILARGAGATLDAQSTLRSTGVVPSDAEQALAELAGNLASSSGLNPEPQLAELGVRFVLLHPAEGEVSTAATAAESRAQVSLDGTAVLVPVGETAFGTLWRFDGEMDIPTAPTLSGPIPALILAAQLLVFGFVLLLSIPTGAGREAARRRRREAQLRARAARAIARAEERKRSQRPPRLRRPSARTIAKALAAEAAAVERVETEEAGKAGELETATRVEADPNVEPAIEEGRSRPIEDEPIEDEPLEDEPLEDEPLEDEPLEEAEDEEVAVPKLDDSSDTEPSESGNHDSLKGDDDDR